MIDQGNAFRGSQKIFSREEIAVNYFNARSAAELVGIFCKLLRISAGPHQAAKIAKAMIQQTLDQPRADEASRTCDEDGLVGADDVILKRSGGCHTLPFAQLFAGYSVTYCSFIGLSPTKAISLPAWSKALTRYFMKACCPTTS